MTSSRFLSRYQVARLRKAGFTVTLLSGAGGATVSGGTDGLLGKLLPGGRGKVKAMKKAGTR